MGRLGLTKPQINALAPAALTAVATIGLSPAAFGQDNAAESIQVEMAGGIPEGRMGRR